ncbi:MAG: dual specificity protein phosphatase family protein [Phycisphaerae bacterium]|nr:dual specificity protein phosphatase family protein [Phycisphaerae bacterium]
MRPLRPFPTVLLVILLLVPPGSVAVGSKMLRYPRRFAEVVPGQLYRGAFPTAEHIRNLKDDKKIRTVISLTDYRDEPKNVDELRAVRAAGLRFLRFPMPGDGCAKPADLDRAADAIGNRDNWPVFFHCAAGKQRSNAALAAYLMRKCGWPLEQTLDELERRYGLDREAEKRLVDHLTEYDHRLTASKQRPTTIGE